MNTVISIRNATVYLDQIAVLSDVSWQVVKDRHTFVIGANGSGKTTLMRLTLGYVWPVFGAEVKVLGSVYGHCDLFEIRKRVAWVSPFLQNWTSARWKAREVALSGFDGTVGFFRQPTSLERDRAEEVMEYLGCVHLSEKQFTHLSSGERMNVLLARALVTKPQLMILDEACVHLDLKSREQALEILENLAADADAPTLVFVTQRVEDLTPCFTHGMALKSGRVVADGPREDVIREDILSNVFDVPVRIESTPNGRYWASLEGPRRK